MIRILVERDLPLRLHDLVERGLRGVPAGMLGGAQTDLAAFISSGCAATCADAGYTANEVDAVRQQRPTRSTRCPRQLEAVRRSRRCRRRESLAAANKRVANILRQAAAKGESFARRRPRHC